MFSVTKTELNVFPICTKNVWPTKSGVTIERRDHVLIGFFTPALLISPGRLPLDARSGSSPCRAHAAAVLASEYVPLYRSIRSCDRHFLPVQLSRSSFRECAEFRPKAFSPVRNHLRCLLELPVAPRFAQPFHRGPDSVRCYEY